METKICGTCKKDLPLSAYFLRKDRGNKPRSYCKGCALNQIKSWRGNNLDKTRETGRDYYYKNHEKMLARNKTPETKARLKIWREGQGETLKKYKREKAREYYQKDPEKKRANARESMARQYLKNPKKFITKSADFYKEHKKEILSRGQKYNKKLRASVLVAYGGKCTCCGEDHPNFLAIDHVNNDGAEHRKTVGSGGPMYRWLIKNDFPEGFQVLCHNCNVAKAFYGPCPHQLKTGLTEPVLLGVGC